VFEQLGEDIVNLDLSYRGDGLTTDPVSCCAVLLLEWVPVELIPDKALGLDSGQPASFDGNDVACPARTEEGRYVLYRRVIAGKERHARTVARQKVVLDMIFVYGPDHRPADIRRAMRRRAWFEHRNAGLIADVKDSCCSVHSSLPNA